MIWGEIKSGRQKKIVKIGRQTDRKLTKKKKKNTGRKNII